MDFRQIIAIITLVIKHVNVFCIYVLKYFKKSLFKSIHLFIRQSNKTNSERDSELNFTLSFTVSRICFYSYLSPQKLFDLK